MADPVSLVPVMAGNLTAMVGQSRGRGRSVVIPQPVRDTVAAAGGTKADFTVATAASGSALWNLVVSGELNQVLAALGGILTIIILVQRIVINWRRRGGPRP